jgi:hypothetical protein
MFTELTTELLDLTANVSGDEEPVRRGHRLLLLLLVRLSSPRCSRPTSELPTCAPPRRGGLVSSQPHRLLLLFELLLLYQCASAAAAAGRGIA